jgi:hypothetical protein
VNLFWKDKSGKPTLGKLVPFSHEDELERLVFDNSSLLGDIFFLGKQIKGGGKTGIPDVIGIDASGNVCVIEFKNVRVDSWIVPQVLGYAIWAESHPDSIKSMWLETKNQPDDLTPDFDGYEVRIIVVAPAFEPTVPQHMLKINYEVDLMEISRFEVNKEEFILLNRIEAATPIKHKTAQGTGTYDFEFYEKNYNKASVQSFFEYLESTKKLIEVHGWPLDYKMNKGYAVFKVGSSQCFGIHWRGSKSFGFFFKLTEPETQKACPKDIQMTKYSREWKQSEFKIEPGKSTVEEFLPLMKACVEKLVAT